MPLSVSDNTQPGFNSPQARAPRTLQLSQWEGVNTGLNGAFPFEVHGFRYYYY